MSALIYVKDVAQYFRDITNDPDLGFVSDAVLHKWLRIGYDHYFSFVVQHSSDVFTTGTSVVLSDVNEYDLNGTLLGPAASAATRLHRLLRVMRLDATGWPSEFLYPVASREELHTPGSPASTPKVLLSGRKLFFDQKLSGTFGIEYVPVPNVDWTKTGSAQSEYIDDLIPWHDIIALYAALQYRASDGEPANELVDLLQVREKAYVASLQIGRSLNASRYVHVVDPW